MASTTVTLSRIGSEPGFAYWGEREGWLIALSVHRDSDALDRSNWGVITKDVLSVPDSGENDLGDAAIEGASHFLVGWVDYLLVRPGTPAAERALEWRERLEDYPVADEMHMSELEWDEEWCVRCDMATRAEHPTGSCRFRSEDDAREIERRWRTRN